MHLSLLWLPNVELALERIADRVAQGGHDVPAQVVRRRFDRSLRNFHRHYRQMMDSWIIFDNSAEMPRIVAQQEGGSLVVADLPLFDALRAEAEQ